MRLTSICNKTHLGMQYKVHWMLKRKRKVVPTIAESVLVENNVKFVTAESVLRPSLQEELFIPDPESVPIGTPEAVVEKPPIFVIGNKFSPIEFVAQSQLLTNSIIFDQLPDETLKRVEKTKDEDIQMMQRAIIKSNLLDGQQDKLPKRLDPINEPGYGARREYGPSSSRLIKSLMHQMVHYNNFKLPHEDNKNIVNDVMSRVDVNHSGHELHFKFRENFLLCAKKPIAPVLDSDAVKSGAGATMPDISPFSPFVHVYETTQYPDEIQRYCNPGGAFAPHTVFLEYIRVRPLRNEEELTAKSLLRAFGNSASYAKEINPEATGDLEHPVTINLVHTNGSDIQFCKYQLNTLDMTGRTKNYFWYSPLMKMFTKVSFKSAKPTIEDLNTEPLSIMNSLINNL